jgi:hypothetical protein
MNNAAMNMEVQLSNLFFIAFEYTASNGIATLFASSVFISFEEPPSCFL